MQYRHLGQTPEKVSALGFGCMRLPVEGNDPGRIDSRKATALVHEAIELGINYFDTAYTYHNETSEAFLSKALSGSRRQKVLLADKLPSWKIRNPDDPEKFLDEQLRRLGTDCIDVFLLHSLRKDWWENLKRNDILNFLELSRRKGKIRYTGFSFHDEYDIFSEIVDSWTWDVCQIQYNYMDEEEQAGRRGLHYAHKKGLGVVVMEPLKGGYLTRYVPPDVLEMLDQEGTGYSPAEWALRWVWNQAEVDLVLSGMGSREELHENCRVASAAGPGNLTSGDKNRLREVRDIYLSRSAIPCTGCGYCLPCPEGVEIRDIFGIYNNLKMFENSETARSTYRFLARREATADHCVECGNCEELCPQDIAVIEKLKSCHLELAEESGQASD